MKNILIIVAILSFFVSTSFAVNENVGTESFSFLRMDISARANGMAGAYTALSNDVNAVFYNPAGLSLIKNSQLTSTFSSYLLGIPIGTIAYTTQFHNNRLAVFSQYLSDEQDKTDIYGINQGKFGVSDLIMGISYAKQIHPVVYLGFSLKYLIETIDQYSASIIVTDFGLIHQTTNKNLKVGIVLKNLGFQLSYFTSDKTKEKLPKTVIIGLNYFPTSKINILLDVEKPFYSYLNGKVGIEYRYNNILSLRSGFNSKAKDWNNGGKVSFLSGFSLGFGIKWKKYNVDYAIKSYGDLGLNNQISLKYSF